MAESIKIKLDGSQYRLPTQEDITSAKQFILRRNDYARLLESKVDDYLEDAAQDIVTICYKYNVDPKDFAINSKYNEKMMEEISEVMDELEADIMSFIYDYSLRVTDDKKHRNLLAAWIATLGRGNKNLQDTLDGYLYKTMKDWEAAIAALRFSNVAMADAVTKVKSYLHSIYTMPEVTAAFKHADDFNATYIQSHGVMSGGVGLSNNGSTNVTNMAKTTLQMAWMREQGIEFEESGAAGYYQLRGSSYPCDICDDEVGFHEGIEEIYTKPYPHPHCCCYRVPIYNKEKNLYEDVETENGKVKVHKDHGKNEKKENKEIAKYLANKYGYEIDLLPIIEGKKSPDSYNHTLKKNQEYKVNSIATKSSIDNLIREGKKQADSLVIRLDSDISLGDLKDAITDRLRRAENIKDITLIKNGLDVTYNREQILSKEFKIQPEDFK